MDPALEQQQSNKNLNFYIYLDIGYIIITFLFIIIGVFIVSAPYTIYVFVLYMISMLLAYLYQNKYFNKWFNTDNKKKKHTTTVIPQMKTEEEEVFHIANKLFNYKDAQSVCKAYGGRLANYKDLEQSYKKGADWCTYGWSEDKNVFFPTQQTKYDKLSTIKGHEHDCGHPGINGGYIANDSYLFGVNCYGKKPEITDAEKILMSITPQLPIDPQDIDMENNISKWKKNKSKLLLMPFNTTDWNEPYVRI